MAVLSPTIARQGGRLEVLTNQVVDGKAPLAPYGPVAKHLLKSGGLLGGQKRPTPRGGTLRRTSGGKARRGIHVLRYNT